MSREHDITVTVWVKKDNSLMQDQWAAFTREVGMEVLGYARTVDASGCSPGWDSVQVAVWVVEIQPENVELLKARLAGLREKYSRAIGWVAGKPEWC